MEDKLGDIVDPNTVSIDFRYTECLTQTEQQFAAIIGPWSNIPEKIKISLQIFIQESKPTLYTAAEIMPQFIVGGELIKTN